MTTLAERIERAFDYRGYVTIVRHDGTRLVGFVYDRGDEHVEIFDEKATTRIRVRVAEIADVELSGDDAAEKAQRIWERRKGSLEPRETPAWGAWAKARPVLFVAALPIELGAVATAVRAVVIGVGGAVAHVVEREQPGMLVSCGFSGGLAPGQRVGDLVLASGVRDEVGELFAAPAGALAAARQALGELRLAEGEFVCGTRIAGVAEKRAMGGAGRLAFDLESATVARAASRAGIPWLALRVILDPVEVELPPFVRVSRGSRIWPALRHALGGPGAAVEIMRLARAARVASRALARGVARLAPALESQ